MQLTSLESGLCIIKKKNHMEYLNIACELYDMGKLELWAWPAVMLRVAPGVKLN